MDVALNELRAGVSCLGHGKQMVRLKTDHLWSHSFELCFNSFLAQVETLPSPRPGLRKGMWVRKAKAVSPPEEASAGDQSRTQSGSTVRDKGTLGRPMALQRTVLWPLCSVGSSTLRFWLGS